MSHKYNNNFLVIKNKFLYISENYMRKIFFLVIVFIFSFLESVGTANIVVVEKPQKKKMQSFSVNEKDEIHCLAKNIYFEAAVESTAGKLAVALVTYNRTISKNFPNTICDVVHDSRKDFHNNPILNRCQFSWYCDGKPDIPFNGPVWKETQKLAKWFYVNREKIPDITDGSTHYHTNYIKRPYWSKVYAKTVSIDKHIFYKE